LQFFNLRGQGRAHGAEARGFALDITKAVHGLDQFRLKGLDGGLGLGVGPFALGERRFARVLLGGLAGEGALLRLNARGEGGKPRLTPASPSMAAARPGRNAAQIPLVGGDALPSTPAAPSRDSTSGSAPVLLADGGGGFLQVANCRWASSRDSVSACWRSTASARDSLRDSKGAVSSFVRSDSCPTERERR
jgi:hypothetical protein